MNTPLMIAIYALLALIAVPATLSRSLAGM